MAKRKILFVTNDIGTKIRNLRITKNIKQDAFAYELGISQATLSKIESNQKDVEIGLLQKIASILDTSINYFTSEPIQIHQENNHDNLTGGLINQNISEKTKIVQLYEKRLSELEEKIERRNKKIEELKREIEKMSRGKKK